MTEKQTFCTNCGTSLRTGAKFCTSCGTTVRALDGPEQSAPTPEPPAEPVAATPPPPPQVPEPPEPAAAPASRPARRRITALAPSPDETSEGPVPPAAGDSDLDSLPTLYLLVVAGVDRGSDHRVFGMSCAIGRGDEADLKLNDETVSRRHAELVRHDRGWRLADLGSSNGTSLNSRVGPELWPADGDLISVGQTTILVKMLDIPNRA